ncbi:hypothetical protein E2C01_076356 [Portunus trituberculatus]|uniref:Uncharacterized protein n=1 Tax=Portunus trituberculatus TaxID=210409 RepID=A0A5B7IHL8_PORTR|nr:hypothetical protein [Portunus trituberculatus]
MLLQVLARLTPSARKDRRTVPSLRRQEPAVTAESRAKAAEC